MKSFSGSSKCPVYCTKAEVKLKGNPELYRKIGHLKNCRDFKQYEKAKKLIQDDYAYWVSVIVDFLNV